MTRRRRFTRLARARRGLTLIELLIALAITATLLAAMLMALQAAFRDSFVILAIAFLLTLAPTLALRPRQRGAAPAPASMPAKPS